jgi:tripartite-type tricarboxylate transporter receptor subunit TctC
MVTKVNGVIASILAMPAVRTKLLRSGYVPAPMSPEEYARFIADDVAQMISLGKQAHIEPVD